VTAVPELKKPDLEATGPNAALPGAAAAIEAVAAMSRHPTLNTKPLFKLMVEKRASDLFFTSNAPIKIKIEGQIFPINKQILPPAAVRSVCFGLMTPQQIETLQRELEIDFAISEPGLGRFRVNIFYQRGYPAMVLRYITADMPRLDSLGLPDTLVELSMLKRGLILLVGATGSGKSTTLAAMVNHRNENASDHIVTIEDPIEFVHQDKRSVINQREVGMDTASFKRALRRVLRQDPDVLLVGEMRDEETVQTALSAAETGHLVLSTIHTVDATESINRMLDFFPPHQHQQARSMIAGTVKGVISQRLVPGANGGRVAVCEILRMTGRVRDMIIDPTQTGKLVEVISSGAYYGMQTFDQALFGHLKAGRVTLEDAMRVASSPADFKLLVQADGKQGTTMEDVAAAEARRDAGADPANDARSPAAPLTVA
jgi:pilus retraction protein PilT